MSHLNERLHDIAHFFGKDYSEGQELFAYLARAGNLQEDLPLSVIINGQSNAVAGPPAPVRGASPMTKYLGPNILGFSAASLVFEQAVDGGASAQTTVAAPSATTGAGVGQIGAVLCRRLTDKTNQTIHTYCLAYTAQGIDYFLPSSGTAAFFDDNTQHPSLNNYNLLKSYVALGKVVPQLYVWEQGEANAGMSQADYYVKLKTLFDQTRLDYPGIRWVVVSTVGNKQNRGSAAGSPLSGVNDAKKQLAAENPGIVTYIDITDFAETAYMSNDDTHLATYCGYVECAERIYAALAGLPARPAVSSAPHIRDVITWTEFFYANKTIAAGNVSQWQTDVPPNTTVMVPHTNAPANIPFDANFGYMTCVEFDRDNSETLKKTGITAANNWTVFMVFRADLINAQQFLATVQDAGSGNRAGMIWAGNANALQYFYDPVGSADFSGGGLGYSSDKVATHSLCWVLDTSGTTITLYVDGVLFGTATISGTEVNMTEVWLASILNTSNFKGRVAAFGYARNVIATAQQAADMHSWAKEEFKI